MKKIIWHTLIVLLAISTCYGQENELQVVDSLLLDYLEETTPDKRIEKIQAILNYASLLPPAKMIDFAGKIDKIIKENNDSLWEYSNNGMYARAYLKLSIIDSVLKYSINGLEVAEKYAAMHDPHQNDWKARSLQDLSLIGISYEYIGDKPKALECYLKCLTVIEEIGYYAYKHYFILDIGNINEQMGNHEKAAEYFDLSYEVAMENKDTLFIMHIQNARAIMYYNSEEFEKALETFYLLLEDVNKYQLYDRVLITHTDIGNTYRDMENFDSAVAHYEAALEIMDFINTQGASKSYDSNITDTLQLFVDIGMVYTQLGNFDLAIKFLDRVKPEIEKVQMVHLKYQFYRASYLINKDQGNFQQAIKDNEQAWTLRDSLDNQEKQKAIAEIQTKYETDIKEQQILNLENKNQLNELRLERNRFILFGTIALLILILFTGLLLIRQKTLKNQQKTQNLEQRLLRAQMNPHFIFNSLASIQNFIVKQDDTRASIYLSRFSELVRSILDNSLRDQITLEEELSTIENYLELQKIRFPEKFDYRIEVDERLDPEGIFIPPMLSQPFIENAIEHGIKQKGSKGNILVSFKKQNGSLIFEVEDDGIGRQMAREILLKRDKEHKSLATLITRERIRVMNKKLKQKISLKIIDLKNELSEATGTRVVFEIPV